VNNLFQLKSTQCNLHKLQPTWTDAWGSSAPSFNVRFLVLERAPSTNAIYIYLRYYEYTSAIYIQRTFIYFKLTNNTELEAVKLTASLLPQRLRPQKAAAS
jgi:hypothetical protein